MSAEVQPVESITPDAETVDALTPAATLAVRPQIWQRRRYQVSALVALVAAVAAVAANNIVARQYTPDAAVRQYLSALQSGDATTVWDQVEVSAPTAPVVATLTDRAALQAALGAGKPDIKDFSITSTTNIDASTASVGFSYDTSSGTKQGKFIVQRSGETHFGLYPVWHLVITPALLRITLPKGSNGVSIDGKAVALPPGAQSTVAVLPLAHKVQFNGTPLLASQTVAVDASFSLGQPVAFQPQLTAAGLAKAKAAVKAAFAVCAQQTSPNADSGACPQTIGYSISGSGNWKVVGDPTQDMVVSFDKDMNAVATGHYQMVFAFQESGVQGVQHSPGSGGYSAALALTPDAVTAASIQPADGLPALARSAGASDQAAKDLVAQAFKRCAAVRAQYVADCPQALLSLATNVRWALVGNPLSGASVNFDQNSGQFTVHGNFAMNVTYAFFGNPNSGSSFNTTYVAYLFWSGKSLQLVTIDGANS
jgi:hypothetical protein